MQISYNRTHRESFMIIQDTICIPEYEKRILKENEIRSLLSFHTMQTNDETQIWYDISGKQSLKDFLDQEEITFEILERIMMYAMLAFEELHKYLIKQEHILLCPEMIYVSRYDQFRMYFCFYPNENNRPIAFSEIMEHILSRVNHNEEDIMQLCYKLYEMSLNDKTTLLDLHSVAQDALKTRLADVTEVKTDKEREDVKETDVAVLQEAVQEDDDIYYKDKWEEVMQRVKSMGQQLLQMIAGWRKKEETELMHQDFFVEPEPETMEHTQLLYSGQRECQGQLVYQGNKSEKNYTISKPVFRIGHGIEGNDASLQSNAVSRMHAKICVERGEYFIEDLNSTNGTYVNGELLSYKQKQKLSLMDQIQFADVCYIFE